MQCVHKVFLMNTNTNFNKFKEGELTSNKDCKPLEAIIWDHSYNVLRRLDFNSKIVDSLSFSKFYQKNGNTKYTGCIQDVHHTKPCIGQRQYPTNLQQQSNITSDPIGEIPSVLSLLENFIMYYQLNFILDICFVRIYLGLLSVYFYGVIDHLVILEIDEILCDLISRLNLFDWEILYCVSNIGTCGI